MESHDHNHGDCHCDKPSLDLSGRWLYRSFHNDPNADAEAVWFVAEMVLAQNGMFLSGILQVPGSADYQYQLEGVVVASLGAHHQPAAPVEPTIIRLKAVGRTEATKGHEYEYLGYYQIAWPLGVNQLPAFSGSVLRSRRPDDASKEGKVGSFVAVRK